MKILQIKILLAQSPVSVSAGLENNITMYSSDNLQDKDNITPSSDETHTENLVFSTHENQSSSVATTEESLHVTEVDSKEVPAEEMQPEIETTTSGPTNIEGNICLHICKIMPFWAL